MSNQETTARQAFIARLRAADCSWDQVTLVALAHTAANEIERLTEIAGEMQDTLQGAIDNSFYVRSDGPAGTEAQWALDGKAALS